MNLIQPIYPFIFSRFTDLVAAQSTRKGGVSQHPYQGLNLGTMTADDKTRVNMNKAAFCQHLGFGLDQIARSHQVHGDEILCVEQPGHYSGFDALLCQKKDIFLAVSTADCVPILIFDPVTESVAAVHAGWKGTVLKLAPKTINQMTLQFGSDPSVLLVYIGACIDRCHFEVGKEVLEQFDESCRSEWQADGKGFVDLKAANFRQILDAGVSEKNIEVSPLCTYDDADLFYSHRRDQGITGRMWSVIGLKNKNNQS